MARECDNELKEASNGKREREGPKKSAGDRVIVSDREGPRDSERERERPSGGTIKRERARGSE